MNEPFRLAICNEVFQGWNFAEACKMVRAHGYDGLELAPFTLAEDPATLPDAQIREFRRSIEGEGLEYVGLHWIMVSPKGLHVTTPDRALRERSWNHIRTLIDLSAKLGDGGVLVFGSPYQRATTGGLSRQEATKNFVDGLASIADQAASQNVRVLVEALPVAQSDVVQTLDEAAEIVRQLNHPGIRTMFDTHNAIDEAEPHAALVEKHFGVIEHVHVNELDGKHPGQGDYDFKPLFAALARLGYKGWISMEAFDFAPGAETISRESIEHLRREIREGIASRAAD